MSNRLENEKSPYLQQHAENPVDWYPWGAEAFQKAKTENKPVFLSIGYATCHWCHVMAHESFEDPEIANMMNEAFINVKVDREERPDIDSMYMTVCQMLTGHGGWPLTIIMTPDKEPFFAGTYIPKDARFNRIGLRQLIPGVKGMWENEPKRVQKATEKIREGFTKSQDFESGDFPGTEAIDFAAEQLMKRFDDDYGGFADAPKFPSPHNLLFLLRQWKMTGEDRFLDAVTLTLTQMRLGGMWDHIGFGFHRYSTDRQWLLPHFEKMLYDQALLMMAYTEAWQITQDPLFIQTVYEIADYVKRKLTHSEDGFYSAEDADSEGEEGKFYVWNSGELNEILSDTDVQKFEKHFNFTKEGNFEEEASKQKTGLNIPHLKYELSDEDADWFSEIRQKIYQHREKREKPLRDEKILTDWNSLMICAFAKAGFVFNEEEFTEIATSAFQFIEKHLTKDGKLLHRFKDDDADILAMGDDYAFMIWACIELYESTFQPSYLQKALKWNEQFIEDYWDDEKGGFYLSVIDEDQVYGRQKQIFDGAIPSSNSVAMHNLLRLSRLTGKTELENYTDQIGKSFSADLIRSGSSICHAMQSIQFLNADTREISLAAEISEVKEVLKSIRNRFNPFSVFHFITKDEREYLSKVAAYTSSQKRLDDKPSLYICKHFACEQPINEVEDMIKKLGE